MNPRCVSIIHQQFIIIFTWPLSIMSVSSKPSSCYICYKHEFVTTSDLRKHVTECVPTCAMFIKNSECSKCLQIFGDNWLFYLHLPQCVSTNAVLPTSHIMVPSTCTPLSLLSGGTVDKSGWIDPLSNKSLIPPNTPPLFFVMPLVDDQPPTALIISKRANLTEAFVSHSEYGLSKTDDDGNYNVPYDFLWDKSYKRNKALNDLTIFELTKTNSSTRGETYTRDRHVERHLTITNEFCINFSRTLIKKLSDADELLSQDITKDMKLRINKFVVDHFILLFQKYAPDSMISQYNNPRQLRVIQKISKKDLPVCMLLLYAYDRVFEAIDVSLENKERLIKWAMSHRRLSVNPNPSSEYVYHFPERLLMAAIAKIKESINCMFGANPSQADSKWHKQYVSKPKRQTLVLYRRGTQLKLTSPCIESLLRNARQYDGTELYINDSACNFQYPNKCCARAKCLNRTDVFNTLSNKIRCISCYLSHHSMCGIILPQDAVITTGYQYTLCLHCSTVTSSIAPLKLPDNSKPKPLVVLPSGYCADTVVLVNPTINNSEEQRFVTELKEVFGSDSQTVVKYSSLFFGKCFPEDASRIKKPPPPPSSKISTDSLIIQPDRHIASPSAIVRNCPPTDTMDTEKFWYQGTSSIIQNKKVCCAKEHCVQNDYMPLNTHCRCIRCRLALHGNCGVELLLCNKQFSLPTSMNKLCLECALSLDIKIDAVVPGHLLPNALIAKYKLGMMHDFESPEVKLELHEPADFLKKLALQTKSLCYTAPKPQYANNTDSATITIDTHDRMHVSPPLDDSKQDNIFNSALLSPSVSLVDEVANDTSITNCVAAKPSGVSIETATGRAIVPKELVITDTSITNDSTVVNDVDEGVAAKPSGVSIETGTARAIGPKELVTTDTSITNDSTVVNDVDEGGATADANIDMVTANAIRNVPRLRVRNSNKQQIQALCSNEDHPEKLVTEISDIETAKGKKNYNFYHLFGIPCRGGGKGCRGVVCRSSKDFPRFHFCKYCRNKYKKGEDLFFLCESCFIGYQNGDLSQLFGKPPSNKRKRTPKKNTLRILKTYP